MSMFKNSFSHFRIYYGLVKIWNIGELVSPAGFGATSRAKILHKGFWINLKSDIYIYSTMCPKNNFDEARLNFLQKSCKFIYWKLVECLWCVCVDPTFTFYQVFSFTSNSISNQQMFSSTCQGLGKIVQGHIVSNCDFKIHGMFIAGNWRWKDML